MRRIVVPLDGSELSERAIGLGVVFARAYTAELHLVHILQEPIAVDLLLPSLVAPDRLAPERYLRGVAANCPDDIAVRSYVIRGEPVSELLKLTNDEHETMIVMSTHGRSGLGRLMLGSVADKVLRGATVPVALVRGALPVRPPRLRTLIVPLDGSGYAEAALPVAVDLAGRTDATLTLVRICDPIWAGPSAGLIPEAMYGHDIDVGELERECISGARSYLDLIASERRKQGVRVTWEVRLGTPADEIIRVSETTEADLIVISTHGRGGLRRWAIGSVTNEILHRGATPILAIPPAISEQQEKEMADLLSTI